ncbi:mannose-1-phosphate guanylyltransferase [Bacteriovorax sp. Seq25_V]|uniref:mannose-1-phosphate guanylyltransferase n=1 Tax=Bacteriovorax sp. Seq25_V TaxID=1201288 RepID=UPI00038A1184|nr:mannose-1-phosphate guanylyltransferase [Bacteriovorax sp. Seq25_V]EQC46607.1 mannose-1-phosphate guanylyltransferase 1 family protein [Bacteriovorax sp. Seq25_V]
MKNSKIFCLVMAGGRGTRLWPESTEKKPKQYLSLVGEGTLLEQTLNRFDSIINPEARFIVTTEDQRELALSSSNGKVNHDGLILEPAGRNTAPCILLSLASLEAAGATDDAVVAVMPSDHVILDTQGFKKTFLEAVELCSSTDTITTIGIRPHFPHTGYGYIRKGKAVGAGAEVLEFREKPDFETAKTYLATGEFLWNAGMFMGKLGTFKREFAKHSPDMFAFYDKLLAVIQDHDALAALYSQIPEDSIDYAIMEKSDAITTIPASFDWNDLGSWEALEAVVDKVDGNTVVKAASFFAKDSVGNVVYAPDKFVSLINVNDLVVVSNERAVMIMPKHDAQRVKEVVQHLKADKLDNLL